MALSEFHPAVSAWFKESFPEPTAVQAESWPAIARSEHTLLAAPTGSGKTTLVRGILRALGHDGSVKSPTYTLLEPYEVAGREVYHFDLYRIDGGDELAFIGMDEMLDADALKLVEWPERGQEALPEPDVEIRLSLEGEGRRVEVLVSP